MISSVISRSVVVVGGGAGGLVAARELRGEGHRVTLIEAQNDIGGVWIYDKECEDDALGLCPSRKRVHASLYSSLRTNLPREIMGFRDYPFLPHLIKSSVDERRFPGHEEVLSYLRSFADDFELRELCIFNQKVTSITRSSEEGSSSGWRVVTMPTSQSMESSSSTSSKSQTYQADAVVIANGHYSSPFVPTLLRGNSFPPDRQVHAHNYRSPEPYHNQTVLVVGASNSGEDISRELVATAKAVFISLRGSVGNIQPTDIIRCGEVSKLTSQGMAELVDGTVLGPFDSVIWATGYKYEFPFFDQDSIGVSSVEGKRVDPLYLSIFPPSYAPHLSFIGIPWKVVPFPQFEIQARLIARSLSGRVVLPSEVDMRRQVDESYVYQEREGLPLRYTHMQGDKQWGYNDSLAEMSLSKELTTPGWVKRFYNKCSEMKRSDPGGYRDAPFMDDTPEERAVLEEARRELGA